MCLFVFTTFFSTQTIAQERLTPEKLWELSRVGAPVVSPNGSQVLYTETNYTLSQNKGLTNIWLMNADGSNKQNLTKNLEVSAWAAEWHPSLNKFGFLSIENGEVQMFEFDIATKAIHKVTNFKGGISGFHYALSGKHIAFSASVKLEPTVQDRYPDLPFANARIIDNLMYRHWNEWDDYMFQHIFIQAYKDGAAINEPIDIMKGEKYDAPLAPFGGSEEFSFSPDGLKLAYTCKKLYGKEYAESTNSDIYEYDLVSKKTINLSAGRKGYDKAPIYSPDGKYILWSSMATEGYESDKNTIIIKDRNDGTIKDILAKYDQSADHIAWSADMKGLYFTSGIKARYHLFYIDFKKEKLKQITEGRYNYGSFGLAAKKAIIQRSDMSTPNEIFSVDLKKGKATAVTTSNKQKLSKLAKAQIREYWINTTTGEKMQTWVILPPDFDSTKQYPTLLYCQGGPQAAISQYYSFRWNFELMAANDYIIVAPNRHGVPTFGQKWNHQISGDWGGQAMNDYLSAIDYAAELPFVDKERLGCVGASYGGYSVYWLAGNHQNRFKAFIAHCGLYNLNSWYASTEEMFFANYDLKYAPWDAKGKETYSKFNPANFVKNWDAPMLVIHSEKDFRVPIGEGIQAFNSAQLLGVPSRFLYFPTEGHWVLSPQNGVLWHREYFRWLDEYLK